LYITIPTKQSFDIPDSYTKTLHNSHLLTVDKMIARRQRILLVVSYEKIKMLFAAERIFIDGTFSTCPRM